MATIRQELAAFWRKFGTMLDNGVPVLQALRVTQDEASDPRLKAVAQDIHAGIKAGQDMYTCLTRHPALFPLSLRTVVKAAEATGALVKACADIADGIDAGTFLIDEDATASLTEAPTAPDAADDDNAPLQLTNKVLREGFRRRASDIHMEWVDDRLRIRFRVDGVLGEFEDGPFNRDVGQNLIGRIKIMANMDLKEKSLPQDGRILVNVDGRPLDFRVSVVPYLYGECATIRILCRDIKIASLAAQGFSETELSRLRGWMRKPNGIVVVTGPTGCGKSTTLYAMLQELNDPKLKVVTVEDPVEFAIDGIDQLPIRPAKGLTFATAMRALLRQDPDIFMVTEIRDLETAHLLIQAALTGHLVFTTLHTSDAPGALRRLLDMGVDPFLINNTVVGVASQRLIRLICKDCREEYEPESWAREALKSPPGMKFFRGKGCDRCKHTGYRGRTAIHEMLELNEELRQLVARDAGVTEIQQAAHRAGMMSIRENGLARAAEGVTTVEEVLRVLG
jgi:type IV pilus assembly protein PilB